MSAGRPRETMTMSVARIVITATTPIDTMAGGDEQPGGEPGEDADDDRSQEQARCGAGRGDAVDRLVWIRRGRVGGFGRARGLHRATMPRANSRRWSSSLLDPAS